MWRGIALDMQHEVLNEICWTRQDLHSYVSAFGQEILTRIRQQGAPSAAAAGQDGEPEPEERPLTYRQVTPTRRLDQRMAEELQAQERRDAMTAEERSFWRARGGGPKHPTASGQRQGSAARRRPKWERHKRRGEGFGGQNQRLCERSPSPQQFSEARSSGDASGLSNPGRPTLASGPAPVRRSSQGPRPGSHGARQRSASGQGKGGKGGKGGNGGSRGRSNTPGGSQQPGGRGPRPRGGRGRSPQQGHGGGGIPRGRIDNSHDDRRREEQRGALSFFFGNTLS